MTDSPITVLLIHGGGASGWDWHLVAPLLREYGHEVLAPDLPIEDPETGIAEYADFLAAELGDAERVVVVAHSYGGLVAPVLAARRPVEQLILVSAMIPAPGEAPNEWWSKSGYDALGLKPASLGATRTLSPPSVSAESSNSSRPRSRRRHRALTTRPAPSAWTSACHPKLSLSWSLPTPRVLVRPNSASATPSRRVASLSFSKSTA
ncbi:alpha/beta fold hydrolase [Nocardia asteroides]|uniref:alpha/beta fold hydrolase n=1 Tax=Nocardia asteroides TaxID=1824 RepID=UPI001E45349D|nr:alpha/beta fold hydrolase [Nocardia asteroides]UGT62851.1 alpha/beta hydrolase [Nocardia asteroides]